MNWRRGLLRLWIVVAACWIGAVGVTVYFAETKFDIERIERRCIERQKAKGADIAKCTSKAEGDLFLLGMLAAPPRPPLNLSEIGGRGRCSHPLGSSSPALPSHGSSPGSRAIDVTRKRADGVLVDLSDDFAKVANEGPVSTWQRSWT